MTAVIDLTPLASLLLSKGSRSTPFWSRVFGELFLGPLPATSSLESVDLPLLPLWPHCVLDILPRRTSTPWITLACLQEPKLNKLQAPGKLDLPLTERVHHSQTNISEKLPKDTLQEEGNEIQKEKGGLQEAMKQTLIK